jgi:RNA polymerase-binding transcription factor DksA
VPLDLEAVKERLTAERAKLIRSLKEEELPELDQLTYGSQAASASQVFEQSRTLALRGNLEDLLRQVEDALARCNAKTYGICEICGREIPPERLEILPYAARCVPCQENREGMA